jgi:hypothetical protein
VLKSSAPNLVDRFGAFLFPPAKCESACRKLFGKRNEPNSLGDETAEEFVGTFALAYLEQIADEIGVYGD